MLEKKCHLVCSLYKTMCTMFDLMLSLYFLEFSTSQYVHLFCLQFCFFMNMHETGQTSLCSMKSQVTIKYPSMTCWCSIHCCLVLLHVATLISYKYRSKFDVEDQGWQFSLFEEACWYIGLCYSVHALELTEPLQNIFHVAV